MKFRTFWGGYVLIVIIWITTINDGMKFPNHIILIDVT